MEKNRLILQNHLKEKKEKLKILDPSSFW
jgi:hypothetical protein